MVAVVWHLSYTYDTENGLHHVLSRQASLVGIDLLVLIS